MKASRIRRPVIALSVAGALVLSGAVLAGAGHPPDGDAKFKQMDTNQDGMASAEEHAAGAKVMFDRMDADRDGNVTAAEMDAGHAMKHDDGGMKPDKMAKDNMAKDKPHGMSSAEKISQIDSNADGMVSAQEHASGSARIFSEMDADGDGSLTAAEIKAGHEAKMGKARDD